MPENRHAEKRSGELEELPLPVVAKFRLCRPENHSIDLVRERRRTRHGRLVGCRPERPGVDVEPVIFFRRQRQQRLAESALDRAQLLLARPVPRRDAALR